MKKLILFCLLPILALMSACGDKAKDERDVAAAVEKMRAAMLSAKAADLNAIAAADLSYGHSSGKIETKAEFVDTIVSGRSVFVTLEFTDQTIKVSGDTAIVRHVFTAKTNDGGKPGNVKIGILLTWQKQGGAWKLLARQAYKL